MDEVLPALGCGGGEDGGGEDGGDEGRDEDTEGADTTVNAADAEATALQ